MHDLVLFRSIFFVAARQIFLAQLEKQIALGKSEVETTGRAKIWIVPDTQTCRRQRQDYEGNLYKSAKFCPPETYCRNYLLECSKFKVRGVSAVGSASVLGAEGHEFEPHTPDQFISEVRAQIPKTKEF